MTDWIKIGEIGVDAGLCWIGDPCYILGDDATHRFETWDEFLKELGNERGPTAKQFHYKMGHPGLGVCVSTGLGDGHYDVYAKFVDLEDWGRRIAEIKVVFIPHPTIDEGPEKEED